MKKPTKEQCAYVDSLMGALRAFKRGEPVQHRGPILTRGRWVTFDLAAFIGSGPLTYRAKPIRKRNAT